MARRAYLGYRGDDAGTAFAGFFDPRMAPLPGHVVDALHHGPQADQVLPGFDCAAKLLDEGYQQTETGYGRQPDGGFVVSVRTDMPGVSPAMWDWWFGWHGSDTRRYKLWHPRAHASARWADGGGDGHYLGRTSLIEEYLGSSYARAAIRFVRPAELGLTGPRLAHSVAVCARLGSAELPVDIGWFVHHVRATPEGAEMRSRFWMGGQHIAVRRGNRLSDSLIRPVATRQLPDPRDLLVHCAQEMNHLAGFLAQLYARFSSTPEA
ncbi:DAPG hydrolase family protein [Mycolicibacterium sp.]|uniref:DAPG hydrolase family protein n=1 Tax=Mycolicibacterium sp. TaxID=2320850 RepID=UPI003D13385B